ncbi:MAG: hypothetical protein F9K29_07915 [Hyphomicrobiaceae bacterium]|nr:MAG: hypothetical protein F9K29_07915 [Hyphomicrobiaceae bacterium]
MTIRVSIPSAKALTTDRLLTRIRDDIGEAKRRPEALAELKKLLAGEIDEIKLETLAATKGGLRLIRTENVA